MRSSAKRCQAQLLLRGYWHPRHRLYQDLGYLLLPTDFQHPEVSPIPHHMDRLHDLVDHRLLYCLYGNLWR